MSTQNFVFILKSEKYSDAKVSSGQNFYSMNQSDQDLVDGDKKFSKLNLTGDVKIDADITAFINARKKIINQINRN